jgi:single-stranded-DNA-specific exonuclease
LIPVRHPEELKILRADQVGERWAGLFGSGRIAPILASTRGAEDSPERILSPDWLREIQGLNLGTGEAKALGEMGRVGPGSDVVVYGDYDVDGIASTVILVEWILHRGGRARWYIPHRFREGYGFHPAAARGIAARRPSLLLVADCGTRDAEALGVVRAAGIPTLVFDHHLSEGPPGEAEALVNPQIDGDSASRALSAAGLIFSWLLRSGLAEPDWLAERSELAALSTVADCVSLAVPVNRALVREGLRALRSTARRGLSLLMEQLSVDPDEADEETLAMRLIPCLNAAGRLDLADLAVKILLSEGSPRVEVDRLIELNRRRRSFSDQILSDLDEGAFRHVRSGPAWPVGVLSSVASRVCCSLGRPVALAAPAGPVMRGTLRMPEGGDAVAVLRELDPLLRSWGGHRLAGFSVPMDGWSRLEDRMEQLLASVELPPIREEVLPLDPAELTLAEWAQIRRLGPFGVGNPSPLFFSPAGRWRARPLSRERRHARVDREGCSFVAFGGEELWSKTPPAVQGWVWRAREECRRGERGLQRFVERVVLP